MVKFQIRSEGCRAVPGRAVSVGSPIRFFDPILNNALALRASHHKLSHFINSTYEKTKIKVHS